MFFKIEIVPGGKSSVWFSLKVIEAKPQSFIPLKTELVVCFIFVLIFFPVSNPRLFHIIESVFEFSFASSSRVENSSKNIERSSFRVTSVVLKAKSVFILGF